MRLKPASAQPANRNRRRLGALSALLLALSPSAMAAPITVDAGCSLVEAIRAANQDLPGGGCPAGSGADVLVLTADVTLAGVDNVTDGQNGLPSITSEITIRGNGHRIARDTSPGFPEFRLFHVSTDGVLLLENLEITGGSAREGGTDQARGGAIFNRGLLFLVRRVTVRDNVAKVARAGPVAVMAAGGAIYNLGRVGIIESSLISNEASAENGPTAGVVPATAEGGAIFDAPDAITFISETDLTANVSTAIGGTAFARGGALYSAGTLLSVRDSSLVANFARAEASDEALALGGAIWKGGVVDGGLIPVAFVQGSFFQTNAATSPGLAGQAGGGAVFVTGESEAEMDRSTFTSNTVEPPANDPRPSGGAIELSSAGRASLRRVTLVGNGVIGHAGPYNGTSMTNESIHPLLLEASIVADSFPSGPLACHGDVQPMNGGDNLGCLATDLAVTGLSAFATDNGGPTRTHALDPTSNAIDAHSTAEILLDQRGVSALGDVDSGAYEHNPCLEDDPFEILADDSTDDVCPGNRLRLGEPQTHRHCDADWVWFNAEAGKTYELRTLNLVNNADTELSLYEPGCGELLAVDDGGVLGLSSRLLVTTTTDQTLDVEITEDQSSYNPGWNPPATIEGYDVQVTCIEKCACTPPEGPNLELKSDRLERVTVTYEACSTIAARDDWNVLVGSEVTLRAGSNVILGPGVSVADGGTLRIEIDPALLPP